MQILVEQFLHSYSKFLFKYLQSEVHFKCFNSCCTKVRMYRIFVKSLLKIYVLVHVPKVSPIISGEQYCKTNVRNTK
jgi:hypothetical protein